MPACSSCSAAESPPMPPPITATFMRDGFALGRAGGLRALAVLRTGRRTNGRRSPVLDIFLAVDRPHMRWIAIAIRPADAKLLMGIDPSPEVLAGHLPFCPRR